MNLQADKCGGAQPRIIAIRSDGPTRSRRPDTLTDDCPELTVVAGRGGCDGGENVTTTQAGSGRLTGGHLHRLTAPSLVHVITTCLSTAIIIIQVKLHVVYTCTMLC